jgi:hypothetical protein
VLPKLWRFLPIWTVCIATIVHQRTDERNPRIHGRNRPQSVFRRLFQVIDSDNLGWRFSGFQPLSQLLLDCGAYF